jgi:hypothetical protein
MLALDCWIDLDCESRYRLVFDYCRTISKSVAVRNSVLIAQEIGTEGISRVLSETCEGWLQPAFRDYFAETEQPRYAVPEF